MTTTERALTGRKTQSKTGSVCMKCGAGLPAGIFYRMMFDGDLYVGDRCYSTCAKDKDKAPGICRYCGEPITHVRDQKWDHQPGSGMQHRALPLIVEEDRLLIMKEELNSLPATSNYSIAEKLLYMVMARIDKEISKPYRLVFLTWVFDRPVATSKLNRPEMPIEPDPTPLDQMILETIEEMGGEPVSTLEGWEQKVVPALTTGLEPHEAMAILRWAQPAKLENEGSWTFGRTFMSDLRLIRIHIGNQMAFLPEEQRKPKGATP